MKYHRAADSCSRRPRHRRHRRCRTRLAAQRSQAPITIVINQSPWFDGFRRWSSSIRRRPATRSRSTSTRSPAASRSSAPRSAPRQSPFDILIMNAGFFIEIYNGGFLEPITDIDPAFALDPDIYTFDNSVYWDPETKRIDPRPARCIACRSIRYMPLLHYRPISTRRTGSKVPEDLGRALANAKVAPQSAADLRHRPARPARRLRRHLRRASLYLEPRRRPLRRPEGRRLHGHDQHRPRTRAGMETLPPARQGGRPSATGGADPGQRHPEHGDRPRRAHPVRDRAPGAQMDDPSQSAVVGKVDYAMVPPPSRLRAGAAARPLARRHPEERPRERQKAALAFLDWFQTDDAQRAYAEAGSPPVQPRRC